MIKALVHHALTVTAVCGVLLAASMLLAHFAFGLRLQSVLSDSMRPTFASGDVLVTREVPADEVRAGQVAIFTHSGDAVPTAHRVTSVKHDGEVRLTTKGDANPTADGESLLISERVPVMVTMVPGVGQALAMTNAHFRAALVLVVGFLMALAVIDSYRRADGCTDTCTSTHPPATDAACTLCED